jgi:hypothetical protein
VAKGLIDNVDLMFINKEGNANTANSEYIRIQITG